MKEKVNTMNTSAIGTFFQALKNGFENFKSEWLDPDVLEEETELPEELRMVVKSIDEDANKLVDRKYTPRKKSVDLLKKNALKNDLSVKDLKEATKSSPKIQGAEFIEKRNEEIEENANSKEI